MNTNMILLYICDHQLLMHTLMPTFTTSSTTTHFHIYSPFRQTLEGKLSPCVFILGVYVGIGRDLVKEFEGNGLIWIILLFDYKIFYI